MQALAVPETVVFGPFVLDFSARALVAGGEKLALSSRAFDILALLVAERHRVVTKDEILTKVWRGVAVEENNLAVQMSSLRRVLGEHAEGQTLILTVPGQGYRFVARLEAPQPQPAPDVSRLESIPSPIPASPTAPRRPLAKWIFAAIGVAVCAVLVWFAGQKMSATPPARLSIAVLPFRDLSDDHSQTHLADAITDDLVTAVHHLPGAVVSPRGAIEGADLHAPPEQIGRALHARYLVDGSVRGSDGKLHVNAHLIDAQTGMDLPFVSPFDLPQQPLSDAQFAIVARVATALKVKLDAAESERSLRERPNDPDVWDLYFQAAAIHDRSDLLSDLLPAQKMLERAILKAPAFVEAMTELSLILNAKMRLNDDPDEAKDDGEALQMVASALRIAPLDDTTLAVQGKLRLTDGNIFGAEASFQDSLSANPFNVLAYDGLASSAWNLGRWDETIRAVKKLMLIDPVKYHGKLGRAYFMVQKWQEAIGELESSLTADPGTSGGRVSPLEFDNLFLMAAYDRASNESQARAHFRDYMHRWPHRSIWRLSSYFRKAQVNQPGFQFLRDALLHLGMLEFGTPEYSSLDAQSEINLGQDGDFDPAPETIDGRKCIDVGTFVGLLKSARPPRLILDMERAAATVRTNSIPTMLAGYTGVKSVLSIIPRTGGPVIVIGGGWTGWSGYYAVPEILHNGIKDVSWLCGGEEALAEQGNTLKAEGYQLADQRTQ